MPLFLRVGLVLIALMGLALAVILWRSRESGAY